MTGIAALSLREAWRGFARQKSTFLVAVLTLALGLGLCTAMFCVLHGVILRPLPYGDAQRVVVAWAGYEGGTSERDMFNEQVLAEWRQAAHAFEDVAGFRYTQVTLLQRGEPTSLEGAIVSPELFTVLAARALVGTPFSTESAKAQQGKLALLSQRLWEQRFNADPDIAGKTVNLGGEIYTVTGVMPIDFDVPSQKTAVWTPLVTAPGMVGPRGRTTMLVARLRPSTTLAQAQADAEGIARHLASVYPDTHRGMRIHLVPFFDELVKESRPLVLVASAAALLVLLICCANLSNLLLVRAIVKRAEFATRLAIGAGRRHLIGVVLAESLLLALGAGLVGALLARGLIVLLLQVSPVELPRSAVIGHGFQIPLLAAGLVAIATLLIALPPAWEVTRSKAGLDVARGARSTSRRFAREFIVTLELAIALTLLAGSGLMVRTMLALRNANPGWKTDHVLAAQVFLPKANYRQPPQIKQFYENFIAGLQATPGVVSVGASSAMPAGPMGADFDLPIQVPGHASDDMGSASVRVVTPGFFKTLGIPQIEGRDFAEQDGAPDVRRVIVNQAFAHKYLPGAASVVGQQVLVFAGPPQAYEIVGAVGNVHHYGMLREPKPEMYLPFAARPFAGMGVVMRTSADPLAFAPTFRKQLWALDPDLPIASVETMEKMVRNTWSDRNFIGTLLVAFTVVVLVLTALGVFSVVTFSVSRQVRELGIHMALGAAGDEVVRLVMRQSARTVLAGLALGLAGAWGLGRALASQMYGVAPNSPSGLLIGAIGVGLIAALAAYLPSRRAANIDPVAALRAE